MNNLKSQIMAPRKKVAPPKARQVKDEELKVIQNLLGQSQQFLNHIGRLEVEKQQNVKALSRVQTSIDNFLSDIHEKYGDVLVNPSTGVITDREETNETK